MDLSLKVLGLTTVRYLTDRSTRAVLRIGSDAFDRATLARVACFNYLAAANLSAILAAEFQVANTRDLFDHVAPDALALPGLGVVALAVLGAAFEAKGIGGDAPLDAWMTKHRPTTAVGFSSLKIQARKRDAEPRRRRRGHVPARQRRSRAVRARAFTPGTRSTAS